MDKTREAIAKQLGVPSRFVTDYLLAKIEEDPAIIDHVDACRHDQEMLAVVVRSGDDLAKDHSPLASLKDILSRLRDRRPVVADADMYQRRLDTCLSCEYARPLLGQHRCTLCGCVVELKAKLIGETCPDRERGAKGRWQ